MRDKGRTIRVPVHMTEKIRKVSRAYNELSAELERDVTDEEIAERLGWSVDEVEEVKSAIPDASSLDKPVGTADDSSELGSFIEDEKASDTPGEVMREMETVQLKEAVEKLPEAGRATFSYAVTVSMDRRSPRSPS